MTDVDALAEMDAVNRRRRELLAQRIGQTTDRITTSHATTVAVYVPGGHGEAEIGYSARVVSLDLRSVPADLAVRVVELLREAS